MKRLVVIRRTSQIACLVLFIYILWSTTYPLKGILPPGTFFKINPLVMIMTSVSERVIVPGLALSIIMLLLTAIFGRFFCGWICPLGTAIDMAGSLGKKERMENDILNARIRKAKFIILAAIGTSAAFARQVAWIFDPMVIMARFVSLNLIPAVTFLINGMFIILIKEFHLYGPMQDLYRAIKPTILGVKVYYFAHSGIILMVFVLVSGLSLLFRRFWCRALCPLGALYALFSNFAPLARTVEKCVKCKICKSRCRTGAIKDDLDYVKSECVLCMDCIYDCPQHVTRFRWRFPGTF